MPLPTGIKKASVRAEMGVYAESGRAWIVHWVSGPKLQGSSGWLEQ